MTCRHIYHYMGMKMLREGDIIYLIFVLPLKICKRKQIVKPLMKV